MSALAPLLEKLYIQTKDLQIRPLELNWAQREFLGVVEEQLASTGRIRVIILKARQLGMSTATEALLFTLAFLFHGYRGMVIAHEVPASQNLLAMTTRYWDTYRFKKLYTPRSYSKNNLSWVESGSSLTIATAGNKAVGRSATIHGVHASEVAFWPEPEVAFGGLRQTVPNEPGTAIIIESTANGVGNFFHREWVKAENGESEFRPLFFPWWRHYEYKASWVGLPAQPLGQLSSAEKLLAKLIPADELEDRLLWRRWAIPNLCQNDPLLFMQEYPATPEEAFIASGTNVFPLERLRECYEPQDGFRGVLMRNGNEVEWRPASNGPLTIFKKPDDSEWGRYVVAGDPTHSTFGDYAVAQVLNRRTLEQVAVWRGRCDPGTFGEELFKLGLFYNEALVTTEIEGPGYASIGTLLGMNYPKLYRKARPDSTPGKFSGEQYGWSTTMQSKQLAVGWTLKAVMDGSLVLHDRKTFEEMSNFVTLDNGGYGNANGEEHDDTVMALAIGLTCHMLDGPVMAYGADDQPKIGDTPEHQIIMPEVEEHDA